MSVITPNHHQLDTQLEVFDAIPDTFGIYVFYREQTPIYIGKSIQLRQRVISHFQQSSKELKEYKIIHQSTHIGWEICAGEHSALLKEAQLVKQYLPIFNRRLRRQKNLHTIRLSTDRNGYLIPKPSALLDVNETKSQLYGPFKNQRHRLKTMEKLLTKHQLCAVKLGLEFGHTCFNYQINRCHGACAGKETSDAYNERLLSALANYRQQRWPFEGPVYCSEHNRAYALTQHHKIDQWHHLMTTTCHQGRYHHTPGLTYDLDTYHLLVALVKACPPVSSCPYPASVDLIELS